jgi:hypothetical protein
VVDPAELELARIAARTFLGGHGLDPAVVDHVHIESAPSRGSLELLVRAAALRLALAATRSTDYGDAWPWLAPADKLILALRTHEQLSVDDIARFYQIPRDSAQRRIDEALARRDLAVEAT